MRTFLFLEIQLVEMVTVKKIIHVAALAICPEEGLGRGTPLPNPSSGQIASAATWIIFLIVTTFFQK
jgi:hypothetical protein